MILSHLFQWTPDQAALTDTRYLGIPVFSIKMEGSSSAEKTIMGDHVMDQMEMKISGNSF